MLWSHLGRFATLKPLRPISGQAFGNVHTTVHMIELNQDWWINWCFYQFLFCKKIKISIIKSFQMLLTILSRLEDYIVKALSYNNLHWFVVLSWNRLRFFAGGNFPFLKETCSLVSLYFILRNSFPWNLEVFHPWLNLVNHNVCFPIGLNKLSINFLFDSLFVYIQTEKSRYL